MNATDDLARLQAAAERAQAGFHHEEAIALYTEAMEITHLDDDPAALTQRYELLFGRGQCYEWIGKVQSAMADFEASADLTEAMPPDRGNLALKANALNWLAGLALVQVGVSEAGELAEQALKLARQAGDHRREGKSLDILGSVHDSKGLYSQSEDLRRQALELYRQAGDQRGVATLLYRLAFAGLRRGASQTHIDLGRQSLTLARQIGDRAIEARALNVLGILSQDLAQKRTYYERALVLAQAVGHLSIQMAVTNNLAMNCFLLGLYRRGLAYADMLLGFFPESPAARALYADIFGLNALGLGLVDEAETAWREGVRVTQDIKDREGELYCSVGLGLTALARGQAGEARQIFDNLVGELRQADSAILSHVLAWKAAAHLALDEIEEAKRASAEGVKLFESGVLLTEYSRAEVWWHHYRALAAAGEEEAAWEALDRARAEMLETVTNLSDEGLRRNYFNKVAVNRDIVHAWLEETAARDLSLEPLTDGLSGTSDLQEQFRRLNEIGVRLNARREERDLPTFILDELIELTGAEEAAVLLLDGAGEALVVAADMDEARSQKLTSEIAQLLDDTGLKRQPLLTYTPDDADDLNQTSILCVPLVTHNKAVGWLYAELSGIYGRFTLQDRDLVNVLANQAGIAVENADWAASLEDKVEQRTAELHAANVALEERTSELAIINKVQEGLAAELDIQVIYDLVGDKIQEIFDAQVVFITSYDKAYEKKTPHYLREKGERFYPDPNPLNQLHRNIVRRREVLVFNENLESELAALGAETVPGTEDPLSAVFAPLISRERVFGVIGLQNLDREHAYSENDVRLLTTLANSLSVALENARLFDETTQRAAELAIINSVQEGLAAELDIQAIYELVGDKIQRIFDAQSVLIVGYDEAYETRIFYYGWEKGERFYIGPLPLNQLHRNIIQRREVLVFNENADDELTALGAETMPGTEAPLSAVFVPLISGERVFGIISLQNLDREHAFSEGDLRLLTTVANSMSVALENARLFDDTQRLLSETEQRNAELAIINSVQQGLVAQVDYQGIIDLVGDKLREVFDTRNIIINFIDRQTNMYVTPYSYEHGQRLTIPPQPISGIAKIITESGQPLVINENMAAEIAAIGQRVFPGTDMAKSLVAVPILLAGRVIGKLQLENHEREYAFSDSDIRLMQTLASSMSVALENARLFDETTQRAAEL
ncbi:MAG: GAF domain-containing protein, partial [Candidatus Promineifilaceae bacterium]